DVGGKLLGEFALHAGMKSARVRCSESRINGDRRHVGSAAHESHRKIAGKPPVEEFLWLVNRGTRCIRELLRRQAGQRCDSIACDDRVSRQWRVTRSNKAVEMIDTVELLIWIG